MTPLLLMALAGAATAPVREVRVVMGTTAVVEVAGLVEARPALDAAFGALQRIDGLVSLWKPSELSRLNEAGVVVVSDETLAVLQGALAAAEASGGAFDPTVEPLVRGSGGLGGDRRELTEDERRRLLPLVGYRRVHVEGSRVSLASGTRLDLGGIAKGYAADLALAALRHAGATGGWVDLGSSSLGVFGIPMSVHIRDPETPQGPPLAAFVLRDASVSTSATDEKGAHILDPRTGAPAAQGVVSATVVASTGMEADALSTALFVLGAEEGLALVERRGATGLVVERWDDGRRALRMSPRFAGGAEVAIAPQLVR